MKPWENKKTQTQDLPAVAQSLTKMVTDKLVADEKVIKHKFGLAVNITIVMTAVYLLMKTIQVIMSFLN